MAQLFPHLDDALERRLLTLGVTPGAVDERFVRGSGAGGQKINKTSSTVWLRHGPTGVEVRCQAGRSQADNRQLAWADLVARLEARRDAERAAVIDEREKERRRARPKPRGLKRRQVAGKRHRAKTKAGRGRVGGDD